MFYLHRNLRILGIHRYAIIDFSYLKNHKSHGINANGTIGTKTHWNRLQCNTHINQTGVILSLFLFPFQNNSNFLLN